MANHNDFEQTSVSSGERCGFWSMFMIMMGFTFFSASMWVGQKIGSGTTFGGFVSGMMAGNLILAVYCSLLAFAAAKTGLSIHLLSRRSFGTYGSYIPSSVLAFTQIGWFGVGVAMFSIPTTVFLKGVASLQGTWLMSGPLVSVFGAADLPVHCLYLLTGVSGLLMTSSAYFGIRALHIISLVAVPSIAVLGLWSAIAAMFFDGDGQGYVRLFQHVPGTAEDGTSLAIGMVAAISMSIGSFISGGSCTPDFARFAKNGRHAVLTTSLAFFIGNSLMFFFGAAAAMVYGKNDISEVLALQGLLLPAIFVLGLNIWTTNDNALYTSGLGLANITRLPKRWIVLFDGVLGTVLALWLYDNFCGWLNILNTVIPPCGAIVIADYFLLRRTGECPAVPVSLPAVVAWALGSVLALGGFGYLPLGTWATWGIPAVNGMVVATIIYVGLSKLGR